MKERVDSCSCPVTRFNKLACRIRTFVWSYLHSMHVCFNGIHFPAPGAPNFVRIAVVITFFWWWKTPIFVVSWHRDPIQGSVAAASNFAQVDCVGKSFAEEGETDIVIWFHAVSCFSHPESGSLGCSSMADFDAIKVNIYEPCRFVKSHNMVLLYLTIDSNLDHALVCSPCWKKKCRSHM